MTPDTIETIQRQIVASLEAGEDVSDLTRRLAQERARIAAQVEIEQLKKIADERLALRDRAEAVKVKVQKQGEAIDAFLKVRDTLVSQLQPLLEPMEELAQMQSMNSDGMGACYSGFNDMGQFAATVNRIPKGYLSPGFGCPFLQMEGGQEDAHDKASEAYRYLLFAHGILTSLQKRIGTLPLKPAEGLMAIDNEPESDPYPDPPCKACQHPQVTEIDKALAEGESLRDIASQYGISKSTVGRHKAHMES